LRLHRFVARSRVEAPAAETFRWHERPMALERLTPPWERVEVLERAGGIHDGGRVVLRVPAGPVHVRWESVHSGYEEGRRFVDRQVAGPFAHWVHEHGFEPDGAAACFLEDRIEFALPLGLPGDLVGLRATRTRLERMFAWRHEITAADLARHRSLAGGRPLRIAATGATGLVGSALRAFLSTGGHTVFRLVRPAKVAVPEDIPWDPASASLEAARLEGLDAVIHLAGESIGSGRWTAARKERILASRVESTRLLAKTLATLGTPPRVLLCASAVGWYGDRGDEDLDDASGPGRGFLADVCREWEAAAAPAVDRGIRVVHLRFGVILSAAGGVLARMVPPFLVGAGGPAGSGRQQVSWISLDDVLGAVEFAVFRQDLAGPVAVTAPNPVPNAELARTLGRVLRRPALAPLPSAAVRLLFGEMGTSLLLEGQRVRPGKLLGAGFRFRHPGLEGALRFELGRLERPPEGVEFAS
jgi:uncharacterized protein